MIPDNIRLPHLLAVVEKFIGPDWFNLDPLTVSSFLEFPDYLVTEKINVLTHIKKEGLNKALENSTFVLLMCSAANNDYADFESITVPTSLELGWCIEEAKLIGDMIKEKFEPSESLKQITTFVLKEDGYSSPVPPLEFAAPGLEGGQSESDTALKAKGMKAYIDFMRSGNGTNS